MKRTVSGLQCSPGAMMGWIVLVGLCLSLAGGVANAQTAPATGSATDSASSRSKNLAPGFRSLPKGAKVVIMPVDMELFSISGGGVPEPKADWTEAAMKFFREALLAKKRELGLDSVELSERDADAVEEINNLHGAVARSIALHHFGPVSLPTKDGKLDWSMGEAVRMIKEKTGADYAIFNWIRDSYASADRKAAMVIGALFGIGLPGGIQIGYSSLVDLNSGRILWFNRLLRGTGDLREAAPAAETVKALLEDFPVTR